MSRWDGLKRWLGPRVTAHLRIVRRGLGLVRWGNLRRTRPFSEQFGFDRGAPIDRYYLDRFLERRRDAIQGRVLEIQVSAYTQKFGRNVAVAHTLDLNPRFAPTYACDLALAAEVVPAESYDCFLLPNTLFALRDIEECLRQALRIVRPGGTILASTAVLGPLVDDAPDYWRMPAAGWLELTHRVWPDCQVTVESHGNCLAAVAAIMGLAQEELTAAELDVQDPRYPVLVTIHCRKPMGRPAVEIR